MTETRDSKPRPWQFFLPSYAVLLRQFRNGWHLAWAHHNRRDADVAQFWDGQLIRNVGSREGFTDTLVEIWGLTEYTVGGFYTPTAADVILDIGANIGLFSIWIARHAPGARVAAFEPFPENYDALVKNLSGWTHQVTPLNMAVGRSAGRGQMLATGQRSLDHRLASTESAGAQAVQVVSLEDAIRLTGSDSVDFLKLDVEGAELDVLEGADERTLRRIRQVAIEYHDNIRPGTLARVKQILDRTHRLVSVRGGDYGILQAELMN